MKKLRNTGVPIDIEPRLDELLDLLGATEGLAAAYLFGSHGTADQTPLSDVDLALVFRADAVPGFDRELELVGAITGALREDDVSVTVLNRAPALFQFRVLVTGRLLLCRDREALAAFVEVVLDRHADEAFVYRRLVEQYDAARAAEVMGR